MLDPFRFQLVTDSHLMAHLGVESIVLSAVKAGVNLIQLREKNNSTREFITLAKKIKLLLAPHQIPLVINDRVDVALASNAHGVHLGQTDMTYTDARKLLGPRAIIGITLENKSQLQKTKGENISYFGISSIYPTNTKNDVSNIWNNRDIMEVKEQSTKPLIGIGGINTNNVRDTLKKGLDGIAVVSAICSSKSLEQVQNNTEQLFNALRESNGIH